MFLCRLTDLPSSNIEDGEGEEGKDSSEHLKRSLGTIDVERRRDARIQYSPGGSTADGRSEEPLSPREYEVVVEVGTIPGLSFNAV